MPGRVLLPAVVGLLIPSLALFRACAGYLFSVNEEPLSVLRLFGVRARSIQVMSALLMVLLCLPGLMFAWMGAWVLSAFRISLSFGAESVFSSHLAVSGLEIAQVLALVVVVVVVSTLLAARDVVLDPLAVRQRVTTLEKPLSLIDIFVPGAVVVLAFFYQTLIDQAGEVGAAFFFVGFVSSLCWAVLRLSRLLLRLAACIGGKGGTLTALVSSSFRRESAGLVGLLKALALAGLLCGFALAISATLREPPESTDLRVLSSGEALPTIAEILTIDGVGKAAYVDGTLEVAFVDDLIGRAEVETRVLDTFEGGTFIERPVVQASQASIASERLRATMSASVAAIALLMVGAYVVYTMAMLERKKLRFAMLRSFGVERSGLVGVGLLHLLVPLFCFGVVPLGFGLVTGLLVRDPPIAEVPLVDPTAAAAGWIVAFAVAVSVVVVGWRQARVAPEVPRSFD